MKKSAFQQIYSKILSSNQIKETIQYWKSTNKSIIFTNGCFDIIHKGHVEYLAKASDLGDKLIIGLNSDSSVKKNKGNNRPINDELSRAIVLAALKFVDAIAFFQEETPYLLIEQIAPDYLVKGGDYQVSEIVGYDIVTNAGGKVVTIPFVKGHSTSNIINKIIET